MSWRYLIPTVNFNLQAEAVIFLNDTYCREKFLLFINYLYIL